MRRLSFHLLHAAADDLLRLREQRALVAHDAHLVAQTLHLAREPCLLLREQRVEPCGAAVLHVLLDLCEVEAHRAEMAQHVEGIELLEAVAPIAVRLDVRRAEDALLVVVVQRALVHADDLREFPRMKG